MKSVTYSQIVKNTHTEEERGTEAGAIFTKL